MDRREEFARRLDGRSYREEITREEEQLAKENGLVVVFGASDDLVEFRGAWDDECGAWKGTTVSVTSCGVLKSECDDEECPYFGALVEKAKTIEAVWCPEGTDVSWEYETEIKHSEFRVMEDGEVYCKGIVFRTEDAG